MAINIGSIIGVIIALVLLVFMPKIIGNLGSFSYSKKSRKGREEQEEKPSESPKGKTEKPSTKKKQEEQELSTAEKKRENVLKLLARAVNSPSIIEVQLGLKKSAFLFLFYDYILDSSVENIILGLEKTNILSDNNIIKIIKYEKFEDGDNFLEKNKDKLKEILKKLKEKHNKSGEDVTKYLENIPELKDYNTKKDKEQLDFVKKLISQMNNKKNIVNYLCETIPEIFGNEITDSKRKTVNFRKKFYTEVFVDTTGNIIKLIKEKLKTLTITPASVQQPALTSTAPTSAGTPALKSEPAPAQQKTVEVQFANEQKAQILEKEAEFLSNLKDKDNNLINLNKLKLNPNDEEKPYSNPIIIDNNSITELCLFNLNIKTLPDSIKNLTNLQVLNLSHNKLETLPESFGDLKNLKTLILKWNGFKKLPESINKLDNLQSLDISNNNITDINQVVNILKDSLNLIRLDISHVVLNFTKDTFPSLKDFNLKYLNLQNAFRQNIEIDTLLKNLPETLEYLDLSYLEIQKISDNIQKFLNLKELYLSSNLLTSLPDSIGDLTNLQVLNLSSNLSLEELPDSLIQKIKDNEIIVDVTGTRIKLKPEEKKIEPEEKKNFEVSFDENNRFIEVDIWFVKNAGTNNEIKPDFDESNISMKSDNNLLEFKKDKEDEAGIYIFRKEYMLKLDNKGYSKQNGNYQEDSNFDNQKFKNLSNEEISDNFLVIQYFIINNTREEKEISVLINNVEKQKVNIPSTNLIVDIQYIPQSFKNSCGLAALRMWFNKIEPKWVEKFEDMDVVGIDKDGLIRIVDSIYNDNKVKNWLIKDTGNSEKIVKQEIWMYFLLASFDPSKKIKKLMSEFIDEISLFSLYQFFRKGKNCYLYLFNLNENNNQGTSIKLIKEKMNSDTEGVWIWFNGTNHYCPIIGFKGENIVIYDPLDKKREDISKKGQLKYYTITKLDEAIYGSPSEGKID